jgi:hypothetical protein
VAKNDAIAQANLLPGCSTSPPKLRTTFNTLLALQMLKPDFRNGTSVPGLGSCRR